MMWRSRNISGHSDNRRSAAGTACVVIILLCLPAAVAAGVYTRTEFELSKDGVSDSNLVETDEGVGLAFEWQAKIKHFGDEFPSIPLASHYPDVMASGVDTFTFCYVDTNFAWVVSQEVSLLPSGLAVPADPDNLFESTPANDFYLHADRGDNGFLVSSVQSGSPPDRYLQLNNGTIERQIDSSVSTGWLFSSQCHMTGDTFLVVNSVNMKRVTLRKIYSSGASMGVVGEVEVDTVVRSATNSLMNCSVAADSSGTILVTMTKGAPKGDKYLLYQFFDRDLTAGPGGAWEQPVSDDDFTYYDDVPLVSYGPGRFALVSWDGSGVLLRLLRLNGGAVEESEERIVSSSEVRFCTIAGNGRYVVIACHGDVNGNGYTGIEGYVYPVNGYTLGTPDIFSFSDSLNDVTITDRFSAAINCAVDDSGTVAVTWRDGVSVKGSIWSYRDVRYRKGFYTSPVESFTDMNDSLQFAPVLPVLTDTRYWFTEDSLRYGATQDDCSAAPWVSFSDGMGLEGHRILGGYFQYRITLNRAVSGLIDSLSTPSLTAVTVPWNTQPRIVGIDSVSVGMVTARSVAFGDTVDLIARKDGAALYLHGYDYDEGDELTFSLSVPATPETESGSGGGDYRERMDITMFSIADTVNECVISLVDGDDWEAVRKRFFLRTRNSAPVLSVGLVHYDGSGGAHTVGLNADTSFVIQEEDTLEIVYSVVDSNDASTVKAYVGRRDREGFVPADSTGAGDGAMFVIRGDTAEPSDTLRINVAANDPDTGITLEMGVVINHRPVMKMVVAGGDTLLDDDTLSVVLFDTVGFTVTVDDTDCLFGDTLNYSYSSGVREGSVRKSSQTARFSFVPGEDDTVVMFRVNDRCGRSDSLVVHLSYPWYTTDSAANPEYRAAKNELAAGASLIAGSDVSDTVVVPVVNTGRDDLVLTGCEFSSSDGEWLTVKIGSNTLTPGDDSLPGTITVAPGDMEEVTFVCSARVQSGDTVVSDTVFLFTNDSRIRVDTFTVRLEYNDLPVIVSVSPDFIADRPYRPVAKRAAYHFPPHASIAVSFSEPVDSVSAISAVRVYSIFDAERRGRIEPVPLRHTWLQNYTVVHLVPEYEHASPFFGMLPPAGLFIPTDSIALVLTSGLTDKARTPSGPNALDVNRDFIPDTSGDTTFTMRVDSIDFTVLSITPQPGHTALEREASIALRFSSPVYAASVDTSLRRNRSLAVSSSYSGGEQLSFSSVTFDSSRVVFTLERELFYNDSLQCTYRSRWIRDMLGFASDNNADGIDATIFDSAAHDDDIFWGYRVRPISVVSVSPDSGKASNEISPLITVHFNGTLAAGTIDTDTSAANRSFLVGTGRTGTSSFSRIEISEDSTSIVIQPRAAFFSHDSVFCSFAGFTSNYRYRNAVNYPSDSSLLFAGYEWYFFSGEVGFYTYPNPYKPGTDKRHCGNEGPCGIWFKNLHALGNDIDEVAITVFSMSAHPVYSSRKAGERIRFSAGGAENLPQWLWDTRNDKDELVATGLYLYAIYDRNNRMLKRGKLIIVR